MQPPISDAALFLKMLVRCPTVLQADVSLPLNVRSEIEVERDVDLINGKQQPFYFEKENLPYEMIQQVLRENNRETLGKFFYWPRCQISRSYSAMVRSEENIPALAMFTRHLRRQPLGSQA